MEGKYIYTFIYIAALGLILCQTKSADLYLSFK